MNDSDLIEELKKKKERKEIKKCVEIKKLIQELSGVINIGIKSRKDGVPDLKKFYCKLCRDYTNSSLKIIAKQLHKTYLHSSVIVAIREFNNLYPLKQLNRIDVYDSTKFVLEKLKKDNAELEDAPEYIMEAVDLLNWFRNEVGDITPIKSFFYASKYFSES